jgi:hypothetical protein
VEFHLQNLKNGTDSASNCDEIYYYKVKRSGEGDGDDREAMESIVVATEVRCWWRSDLWLRNGVLTVLYVSDDLGPFTKYIRFDEMKSPTYDMVIRNRRATRHCGLARGPTTTTTTFRESPSLGDVIVHTPFCKKTKGINNKIIKLQKRRTN